mgnify:CR=1 FL=1
MAGRDAGVGPAALSAKPGVFRGWQVVAAAFSVMFFAYGLQFSYGVFASGMAAELGWSRAATALPYSLYVFLYSALSAATITTTPTTPGRSTRVCWTASGRVR